MSFLTNIDPYEQEGKDKADEENNEALEERRHERAQEYNSTNQ